MAARGNRVGRVARFGVASLATAVAILGSAQTAFAEETSPAASPSETASSEPTSTPAPEAAAPTATETTPSDPPPANTTETPPAESAPAASEPTPAGGADASAPAASETTTTPAAEPEAATVPKDVVTLEPAQPAAQPAAAPTVAAAPPPTAPSSPPAEAASAPAGTVVLILSTPATDAVKPAPLPADGAENANDDAGPVVSFRPRPAVALLPGDAPDLAAPVERTEVAAPTAKKRSVIRQACARPAARVPLSQRCKQQAILAVAVSRAVRTYSPSPEVRAAIDRAVAGMTARPVEARPPPESKAAKKKAHPIAEVRPTIPFGSSGEGASNDGFSSSGGASWSSRVFALAAAAPQRVPRPSRFARIQIPQTVAHGVIAAPPPTRPG